MQYYFSHASDTVLNSQVTWYSEDQMLQGTTEENVTLATSFVYITYLATPDAPLSHWKQESGGHSS